MLNLLPILPHEIICVFDLIFPLMLFFVPYITETQSFIKLLLSYFFTSLKSVFIIGHLKPYWTSFTELTRREPSPVLVGLATRLSVVWCCLEFCLLQPKVDLGSNIVATILGKMVCLWTGHLTCRLSCPSTCDKVQIWWLMVNNDQT